MLIGVASLTMGLVTTLVLLSCLVGRPFGSEDLFESHIIVVSVLAPDGKVIGKNVGSRLMPSWQLMSILLAGGCLGGLGMALAQWQSPPRRAIVSGIGLAVCVAGSLLGWFLIMLAVWQESG
jgi:hypothetical protein